jgi:hypothetical protein
VLKRANPTHWQVTDTLFSVPTLRLDIPRNPVFPIMLHWLLPDWPWELVDLTLTLVHPAGGRVRLKVSAELPNPSSTSRPVYSLVRAGAALAGPKNASPILGWFSPTYNQREPCLSFSMMVHSALPVTFVSSWILEET